MADIPQAPVPVESHKPFSMGAQVCLRFLILTTTLASFVLLITTNETFQITKIEFNALKFFINVNTSTYFVTAASLLILTFIPRYQSVPVRYCYFCVCDMLVLSLEIAGCAVLTGPWYRGQCRDINSGWFPMCYRITCSIIVSYISIVLLLLLIVIGCVCSNMM